jgi:hypothetical protein
MLLYSYSSTSRASFSRYTIFFRSVSDAFSWSTRVSSSANNSKQCQTTIRYPNKNSTFWRATYLCSSDEATCSSEPSRCSSLAFLVPHYGTGRRPHPAWTVTRRSASWPCPAPSPTPLRRAPCHHTPRAYQIFVGTSPRHPTQDNNQYRVLNNSGNSTTQGVAPYLNPLLCTAH